MRKATLFTLIAIALAMPAQAQKQTQHRLPASVMDGFYVTLADIRANSRAVFDGFVGSEDGAVTRAEFVGNPLPAKAGPAGHNPELRREAFGLLDADDDGRLTYAEWSTQIDRDVSFADENEDGRISLTELASARENMGLGDMIGMLF
ncbi:hypothetical protein [Minwuia thermotolerans]|uniref:EF-hand domain-containing protein n=1 Tax=Minwuia thermotolerans TaxID=2056226 RepID=A0A2M9G2J9_9PROT|nr:hypothetical protein [Minwuia thermotolerans]PJK29920.1 hypothetical protein CVT23_09120 [Minwuia thermotolerans]